MISTAQIPLSAARPSALSWPLSGAALARAEAWLFDLDNTLYPADCNLFAQIDQRMGDFIARLFDIPPDEAKSRQKAFFRAHGTTLRGLMVEHGVDPAEFLDYVHDIDLTVVCENPALHAALTRLPGRKIVYTNGSVAHAARVLDKLGVAAQFETVFDIAASDFLPKPQEAPFRKLLDVHGIAPARAAMVEDMARNLKPAAALGLTTIWVPTEAAWSKPDDGDHSHIHHVAPDLAAFLAALPVD